MPYVYSRDRQFVDLLIDRINSKRVTIVDAADGNGGTYVVIINGIAYKVEDPDPAVDSSAAIATLLETAINDSISPALATASGSQVFLVPAEGVEDFSLEVVTFDEGGTITWLDRKPQTYRVENASNWDQPFAPMQDVSGVRGFRSKQAKKDLVSDFSRDHWVRFAFSPLDYGLEDEALNYFQIVPVIDGVDQPASPIIILLSIDFYRENRSSLVLQGNAPVGADPLRLFFPKQAVSIVAKNLSTTDTAYLSFSPGAGEIVLAPGESFANNGLGSSDIYLRSDAGGGAAEVYIYVTLMTHTTLK